MNDASGLSESEARARLLRDGPNRLPAAQHRSAGMALLAVATQPMILLLLACTLLYALLGDPADSAVLALSIVAVAAISVYQELRTQRVLEALRDLASPRSTVVRDGVIRRIPSQELVEGDRLIVQEGDRLACDARLVVAHGVRVDESMLTGESVPVDKAADDAQHALHAGTLIVQGDGVARVTATGGRTALGRIGGSLSSVVPRASRLQKDLNRIVRVVAWGALLTCLLAAGVFAWRDGSWSAGLLVGLTLAMAIVPEEFAVVWTVMLAIGAWRLARQQVLTRQPQAIEALGTTTVLCVDKTGTLTCNRMEVVALVDVVNEQIHRRAGDPLPTGFDGLLQVAALASIREGIEPMDRAIFRLSAPDPVTTPPAPRWRDGVLPGRPFVRQAWSMAGDASVLVAIKGAPEAVLARCADAPARLQALNAHADDWAAQGLRVIAVARSRGADDPAQHQSGFEAIGLLGFQDPLRDDVPAALQECRRAGVRVVMITGDAPTTALAIARQAGLVQPGDDATAVLTGTQLDSLDEPAFVQALGHVAVFARVAPAQKLRIVRGLQRRGDVVAMTGDGVNDGPALRAADVGVAMGERGTDVAREAAALVLMDDRFGSLVDAVRAGRRIFINLQKAMAYVFAVHVPIVGLSLLPLFGGPILLLPVHVVLLELIIDPACSLVFEAEPLPAGGMSEPPRAADAPLFSAVAALRAMAVGAVALLGVVLVQWLGHRAALSDEALRLAAFATIVVGNLAMLQWFRRRGGAVRQANRVFLWLLLCVSALALLLAGVPMLRGTLGFSMGREAGWAIGALALPAGWALWRLFASRTISPAVA